MFCLFFSARAGAADRKVERNAVLSDHDPAARIELPRSVHFLGNDRWILYGIADCDLYAFVEADEEKKVQRLYWVQFEAYLPSRPDLHHTYDSPHHLTISGWDFFVDAWVRVRNAPIDKGSDREHIEALIRDQGYVVPEGIMYVRLVHLLDEKKRKELMIIYGEDLLGTGFTASDLDKDGKARSEWPRIEEDLVKRAVERVNILPQENSER
jgi:hypothetical protein